VNPLTAKLVALIAMEPGSSTEFFSNAFRRRRACSVQLGILLFFGAGLVQPISAQVTQSGADVIPRFESIAPKAPEPEQRPVELPEKPKEAPGDDDVLIESVDGFYFTSKKDKIEVKGRKDIKGIRVEDIEILKDPGFESMMAKHLDKPVSIKVLKDVVRELVEFYRQRDQPVVDVIIPEQEITSGVVQILVVEGRVGEVKVEGNRWFDSRILVSKVRLEHGDPIRATRLIQDIELLNMNSFREVDVAFTPGKNEGDTDVLLKTKDRFPVRFYTGYDDTGNDITGEERLSAGFNWGNALFVDHLLSYQFTTSPDFHTLTAHSVTYSLPFFRKDQMTFYFALSEVSNVEVPLVRPRNYQEAENWLTGYSYRMPLPGITKYFNHGLSTRFDYRRSSSDVLTGNSLTRTELTETFQWAFGYDFSVEDPWGIAQFKLEMVGSPGGLSKLNSDETYETSRTFSHAQYSFYKLEARRETKLPWDFSLITAFTGQLADENLLSNEQMNIGGFSTVRGYAENQIRGDEGYFTNIELRTPSISLGELFGYASFKDGLQFLGFWDYGQVANRTLIANENPNAEVSSAGFGLRYYIDRYFTLRADYGFQLLDSEFASNGLDTRFNSRLHLGIVVSY
jgi:hemolysin activation/secretion protein